ncbi:MAG: tyrosine-type recombinase/integrase [Verrucomicrobiota bacterium]
MKPLSETTTAGAESVPKTKRDSNLSKDGKWRSFPKVPNLLQYVIAQSYYARAKVKGKPVRASLETDVFSTAKLRLPDKLKQLRKPKFIAGTFGEAAAKYQRETQSDHTLSGSSKTYRLRCIDRLLKSWPWLDALPVDKITEQDCKDWASPFAVKYSAQFFNNTVNYFRLILKRAGIKHDDNPAMKIKRLGLKPKKLTLPESQEFSRLLEVVETSGAAQAQDCADLIRFLAYSGCRISEAKKVLWRDVDWKRNQIVIHCAKRRVTGEESDTREVPLIPPMKILLERLQREQQPKPEDRVNVLSECQKSLTRACKILSIHRLTHHDLRHLFASVCIECNVDMQTLSKWLGHSDGGVLAQKVYGHLRQQHSQFMAAKVTFGASLPANVTALPKEQAA